MGMPETIEQRLQLLSAKVTALIMLVESLYAESLTEELDPPKMGDAIIASLFEAEEASRKIAGESDYQLQISETVSSLIHRAAKRAAVQRAKERRD